MSLSSFKAAIKSIADHKQGSVDLLGLDKLIEDMEVSAIQMRRVIDLSSSQSQKNKIALYEQFLDKLQRLKDIRKAAKLSVRKIIRIWLAFQVCTVLLLFTLLLGAFSFDKLISFALDIESTTTLLSIAQNNPLFVWIAIAVNIFIPIIVYSAYPHIIAIEVSTTYKEIEGIKKQIRL